jgi:hypothetical protein
MDNHGYTTQRTGAHVHKANHAVRVNSQLRAAARLACSKRTWESAPPKHAALVAGQHQLQLPSHDLVPEMLHHQPELSAGRARLASGSGVSRHHSVRAPSQHVRCPSKRVSTVALEVVPLTTVYVIDGNNQQKVPGRTQCGGITFYAGTAASRGFGQKHSPTALIRSSGSRPAVCRR